MAKKRSNYFDGPAVTKALNEFYYERQEALAKGLPTPHLPKIVGENILKIAEHYSSAGRFSRVANKQDMISSGVLSAMETVERKYDPARSETKNCFSFLTTLVYFGFLAFFEGEKKHIKSKNAYVHALADGQATISGQTVNAVHNSSLNQLRGIIDDYAKHNEKEK
ncbi:sigma factor for late transcription [Sinorhizobium phage phiM9]|uniref:Sigma factor for late transcription n=1 Tax=Sinorhizobium phage phiM9 TaxID=1636182 RepID=A0A0F6THN3_9CAUD|nr:sigma factor for late transcription [Sinorhizobium phage phiM9]AKE44881.1 sigma factor for late transcription [Sinorhizobium phage phiM9]